MTLIEESTQSMVDSLKRKMPNASESEIFEVLFEAQRKKHMLETESLLRDLGNTMRGINIDDALRYEHERKELMAQILLHSGQLTTEQHKALEGKTISELMRIYYGGIGGKCVRCGEVSKHVQLNTIYRNNAS